MSGWADDAVFAARLDAARRFQRLLAKRRPSGSTFNKRKMQRFSSQVERAIIDLLVTNDLLMLREEDRQDAYGEKVREWFEAPRGETFELARRLGWRVLREPSGPPVTLAP